MIFRPLFTSLFTISGAEEIDKNNVEKAATKSLCKIWIKVQCFFILNSTKILNLCKNVYSSTLNTLRFIKLFQSLRVQLTSTRINSVKRDITICMHKSVHNPQIRDITIFMHKSVHNPQIRDITIFMRKFQKVTLRIGPLGLAPNIINCSCNRKI